MAQTSHLAWLPLGSLLVREGMITPEQLELALMEQENQPGRRLGELLVEWGWVSSREIARALAEQYGMVFVELGKEAIDDQAAAMLDPNQLEQYGALPIRYLPDGLLLVAVVDPTDVGKCDELRELLGAPIRLCVVDQGDLETTLHRAQRGSGAL